MGGLGGFRQGSAASRKLDRLLSADQPWSSTPPPVPSEEQLEELHTLVSTASKERTQEETRALYEHFPLLLRRLFGYSMHSGWLETVSEKPSSHRKAIIKLLFPQGPIHQFCQNHAKSLLFEFPIANLPTAAQKLLYESMPKPKQEPVPFESNQVDLEKSTMNLLMESPRLQSDIFESKAMTLVRLLVKNTRQRSRQYEGTQHVNVSAIMYFLLCMIALPSFKVEKPRSLSMIPYSGTNSFQYPRVPKRSTSLPSLRALYNYLITGYITYYKSIPSSPENIEASTFRASLSTYWLNTETPGFPTASTSDALSCLYISSRYPPTESKRPSRTSLPDQLLIQGIDYAPGYGFETNGIVLQLLHEKIFQDGSSATLSSLISVIRLYCILAFPWRRCVMKGTRSGLLPLERVGPENKQRSRMAWVNETLTSFGESIGEVVERTRGGKTMSDEEIADREFSEGWEKFVRKTESMGVYGEMLEKVIVLAAENRVGGCSEGLGVLEVLARGLQGNKFGAILRTKSRQLNLEDSVSLIEEHVAETRRRLTSRNKSRSVLLGLKWDALDIGKTLARGLGIEVYSKSTSAFSPAWEHVWGRNDAGFSAPTPGRSSGLQTPSTVADGLRSRKQRLLGARFNQDVGIKGSVWDRPISQYENESAVMAAYWASRSLESNFGISVNLRWMGHYALWIPLLGTFMLLWLIKKTLASIM